jgi:hypothetical protein
MQTDYLATVIDATTDFPFVAELPKREKSRLAKIWEAFQEVKAIQATEGCLIPDSVAATLLEVSRVRVEQLCDDGKLKRVMWHGRRFVTENSLVQHARSERKAGRPQKTIDDCASSPFAAFKMAKKFAEK